jgi:hypothetical protein
LITNAGGSKTDSIRTGEPVKISTVNRELSVMQKMMRFAFGKGWILKDIFNNAKVIDAAADVECHWLLTFDEEKRLVDACEGERDTTYKKKRKAAKLKLSRQQQALIIRI